ncbi:MAG TPA: gluconokinase [Candidatus Dormibacteraeota bacterium]|nr:gluconokinase [Candidatus Dormibacteraeota bacterium]
MARSTPEGVLALDLGTSSVRAVVYDTKGAMVRSTLCDLPYKVDTAAPGQVSSDPSRLLRLVERSIDGALKEAAKEKFKIMGVGASCYWHSLMGVDRAGRPTTELLTWADTRSADETRALRSRYSEHEYHALTGCYFHASFWPAKLRWLKAARPAAVRRTTRWISFGEYVYQRLLGEQRVSISIASGTGLLDIHSCAWNENALRIAGVKPDHLSPLAEWNEAPAQLLSGYHKRWPALAGVPWYLPLGDGVLANIGAGCLKPEWFCATIGTSSALRVIIERPRLAVPWGVWVYRLDRRRFVLGGALSEGGNVIRWITDGLGVGHKKKLERAAAKLAPDGHGLTVLPFWAGERSPNWRGDARAAITGLSLGTQPAGLLRSAMEAITYQLVVVAYAMRRVVPRPRAVIATGGQLINSATWTQMLADALGLKVIMSPEKEASSRGAALLTLYALGRRPRLWAETPARGRTFGPHAAAHAIYDKGRRRQEKLYRLLLPPAGEPEHAKPSGPNGPASGAAGSSSKRKDLQSRPARR